MKKLTMNSACSYEPIKYEFMHPKYGRAEFTVCATWKRGRITQAIITRNQQEHSEREYLLENLDSDSLSISSFEHQGVELPKIWLHGWCKEHKTQFIRFYVPNWTDYLRISPLSTLSIYCEKTPSMLERGGV